MLLIGQIPVYTVLPVRCIVAEVNVGRDPVNCGMPREAASVSLQRSNEALRRAAQNNSLVSVSLPMTYMCETERCSPMRGGTLLYKNGGHINQYGADTLRQFVEFPKLP